MKKTLKSIISAVMATAMLGSTAVSVSAYNCGPCCRSDEEMQFIIDYLVAVARADGYSEDMIQALIDGFGDKDYPNPYNGKESEIIPAWYIPGEPIPDWIIGEYYERTDPDSENYTDRYREALENVCEKTGISKEEMVEGDVHIRDSISIRDDIDFDDEVTVKDLAIVKKYLIKEIELTSDQKRALNDDESVSITDVTRISQKLVGKY
ncbi:MAG: dockerin type I repeat-containing protein [Oscillospiraceae bacterium]